MEFWNINLEYVHNGHIIKCVGNRMEIALKCTIEFDMIKSTYVIN